MAHHENMSRWKDNTPRLNGAKAAFLREMNPFLTKIRAKWAKTHDSTTTKIGSLTEMQIK